MMQIIGVKENENFGDGILSKFVERPETQHLFAEILTKNELVIRRIHLYSPPRIKERFVFFSGAGRRFCVGLIRQNNVISYVGKDATCGEFEKELSCLIHSRKTFLFLSDMRMPVGGVQQETMKNFIEKTWPRFSAEDVVEWLVTKEKMNASPKEKEIIQGIVQDIQRHTVKTNQRYPFFPIKLEEVNGTDIVAVGYGSKEFVVGYDNKFVVSPYVLGGIAALKKDKFLSRLNLTSERGGR